MLFCYFVIMLLRYYMLLFGITLLCYYVIMLLCYYVIICYYIYLL